MLHTQQCQGHIKGPPCLVAQRQALRVVAHQHHLARGEVISRHLAAWLKKEPALWTGREADDKNGGRVTLRPCKIMPGWIPGCKHPAGLPSCLSAKALPLPASSPCPWGCSRVWPSAAPPAPAFCLPGTVHAVLSRLRSTPRPAAVNCQESAQCGHQTPAVLLLRIGLHKLSTEHGIPACTYVVPHRSASPAPCLAGMRGTPRRP